MLSPSQESWQQRRAGLSRCVRYHSRCTAPLVRRARRGKSRSSASSHCTQQRDRLGTGNGSEPSKQHREHGNKLRWQLNTGSQSFEMSDESTPAVSKRRRWCHSDATENK